MPRILTPTLLRSFPKYFEAPPYPAELLRDEEDEEARRLLDEERKKTDGRARQLEKNKKMVSKMITEGMINGRKVWTEDEIVDRDLDDVIKGLKERRDIRNAKSLAKASENIEVATDDVVEEVDDVDYNPEKDYDSRSSFRHSWATSNISLIDAVKDKQRTREKLEKPPVELFDREDPGNDLKKSTPPDALSSKEGRRILRRKFSALDSVLDNNEMMGLGEKIKPQIAKKSVAVKESEAGSGRRSFRRSFRKSFDSAMRLVGVIEEDTRRKVHISAEEEDKGLRRRNKHASPASKSKHRPRRRPSLDLQPNLRHLLSEKEREKLPKREEATGGRKRRLSVENAKNLAKTIGTFIADKRTSKKEKEIKYNEFIASIKIKLWIMRRVRQRRINNAAASIQECWRSYRMAVIKERWMIHIAMERAERERMEMRENKVAFKEEKAAKASKTSLRKAAVKAASIVGFTKPPKSKAAKEEIINLGWQKKDDALMLAIQYKVSERAKKVKQRGWGMICFSLSHALIFHFVFFTQHGLPSSWKAKEMQHYIKWWDTKPPKLIFKRIDLLYRTNLFDEITDEYVDLLTDEQKKEYLFGFGTMAMLADDDDWGNTKTQFDYRKRQSGGKFIRTFETVASNKEKYKYNEDGEMESDDESAGRAQPVSRVKIG